MCEPKSHIHFHFVDPTEALTRLLISSPLAANPANMVFAPEASDILEDYCNGARWERVQRALPQGAAALTAVLFFDELNQDQKGFATGEGALIVGGNFRKDARESTYAKSSLGAFPPVDFPQQSKSLVAVQKFKRDLRFHQLSAIRACFAKFNKKGGAVIPLQSGKVRFLFQKYFPHVLLKCTFGFSFTKILL